MTDLASHMMGSTRLQPSLRLIVRSGRLVMALASLMAAAVLLLIWLPFPHGLARLPRLAWKVLLSGFDIRVTTRGSPVSDGAALYVANHVTWADIPVLGLILDAGFVAKREVRSWPIIGLLAERYGCEFVSRESRAGVGDQALAMQRRLGSARRLVLFPEGTTSLGTDVLPFRSSLFGAVEAQPGCQVQPVTLVWRMKNADAQGVNALRRIAWLEDDELLPHALALAMDGGATVEVHFLPVLAVANRKVMARNAQAAIATCLADCQAATLNLAA